MEFRFEISVSVERTEGKFATRDEISEQLFEAIESANPDTISGDNGGEYEVIDFQVEEIELPKKPRRKAAASDSAPQIGESE